MNISERLSHENSWTWSHYKWPNFFSNDEIKKLNEHIENNYAEFEDKKLGASTGGTSYKNISSVKHIPFESVSHFLSPIVSLIMAVVERDFGYNVFYPHSDWYLNHNTYDSKSNDSYPWHIDNSGRASYDIKMTVLINLSEESYDGGEFELNMGEKPDLINEYSSPGSVVMFKSHILHRVKPVTSGIRKSLTLFIAGPKFQ